MIRKMIALYSLILILPVPGLGSKKATHPMLFYGEASWYGRRFHGRRTANGEKFDMNKLTAAHRTLPFGSLVRVTNLENDRSVTVRINDRGPFAKGRVLDLSRSAAQKLGFLGSGRAKVEARVLRLGNNGRVAKRRGSSPHRSRDNGGGPVPDDEAPLSNDKPDPKPFRMERVNRDGGDPATTPDKGSGNLPDKGEIFRTSTEQGYVIQIGAYRNKHNALDQARKLRQNGYAAFVLKEDSNSLFRVWIGYYHSREQAVQRHSSLGGEYSGSFVKKA